MWKDHKRRKHQEWRNRKYFEEDIKKVKTKAVTNGKNEDRKKKGLRGKTETLNCWENKNRFEGKKHLEKTELLRERFMKKDKRKARDKDGIKEEEKRRKMRRIKQVNWEGKGKRKNHRGNVEEFRKNN